MKLWYLNNTGLVQYDSYDAFVVRAESAGAARLIASENAGAEGGGTWLSSEYSTCEELHSEGSIGVVLGSFRAG